MAEFGYNMTSNLTSSGNETYLSRYNMSDILAEEINNSLQMMLRPGFIEDLVRMEQVSRVVVPTVILIILILGLIGNALVVYVTVVTNRTTKHPIHSLFVLNLAAADVLFLLVCAPYWIVINSMPTWPFGAFLCPVIPFLSNCSMAASIYTICALAWVRFMALVMPFRFRRSRMSTRRAGYFVIAAIWIACTILSFPNLIYYGLHDALMPGTLEGEGWPNNSSDFVVFEVKAVECRWNNEGSAGDVFAMVKLVATYILPLLLVSFFYAVIGREVLCYMMHHSANSSQGVMGRTRTAEQKECAKSTMVVLSLILAFLICWFPHLLETVFKVAGFNSGFENAKSRFILESLGKCMSYAHACVNPFIYTFASPIFRRSLRTSLSQSLRSCGKGEPLCNGNAMRSCSARCVKRNASLNFEMYRKPRDSVKFEDRQRASKSQVGDEPNADHIATTTIQHHTMHTTVGTPQTSPVTMNGARYPTTSLLLVEETEEAEDAVFIPLCESENNPHSNGSLLKSNENDEINLRYADDELNEKSESPDVGE